MKLSSEPSMILSPKKLESVNVHAPFINGEAYFDLCTCGARWRKLGDGVMKIGAGEIECLECGRKWACSEAYITNMSIQKRRG